MQPTIEQRIRAAMALAGIDEYELARRIDSSGYSYRTIQRIIDPKDKRKAEPRDLPLIARGCGVSDTFWTADFSTASQPDTTDLEERVRTLEAQMQVVLGVLQIRLAHVGGGSPDQPLEHPADPEARQRTGPPE